VGGELKSPLRAVPAVPRKLILALFNPTLSSCGHTAGVDQVGLKQCKPHKKIWDEIHTHYEVVTKKNKTNDTFFIIIILSMHNSYKNAPVC